MAAVGIDTHKRTLAACALDGVGLVTGERTFPTDPAGLAALVAWVGEVAPGVTVGVEGSSSYGAPAARALHAAGMDVREVPPHLGRRERVGPAARARATRGTHSPSPVSRSASRTCPRCVWRTRARSWVCSPTPGTSS